MAAVLFIVTIPTEAEENRIKNEYMSKQKCNTLSNVDGVSDNGASEIPVTSMPKNLSSKYGTFPKRKKSESQCKLITASLRSGLNSNDRKGSALTLDGGSLKNSEQETTDAPSTFRKSWQGVRDVFSAQRKSQIDLNLINDDKSNNSDGNSDCINLDVPNKTSCMEPVVRKILKKFEVLNVIWTQGSEGRMHQIVFTIEFNETYENILKAFRAWGIGDREGSSVSAMNCITSKSFATKEEFEFDDESDTENSAAHKRSIWNRFMNSVSSRLNVEQILRDVRREAAITFDFMILLSSAAMLAAFGLIENSTIFLAASMLVSPLMGPIIAVIFGTVIKDSSLRTLGLWNELIGILIATVVGFLFGLLISLIDERYSVGDGISNEMLSRCDLHSLLVGICVAIPSGAAAAVSILGGNIGSLVGVAISASLLPPAVNSGLLWSLACIYKLYEKDETRYSNIIKTKIYSDNQAIELAISGAISMCLTISNVICIYIMGIIMLKAKEVAPVISKTNRQFWKHDIKIARELRKTSFDTDTAIINEYCNLPKEDQNAVGIINSDVLRNMRLDEAAYQNTWSPSSRRPYDSLYATLSGNRRTMHGMDRLYETMSSRQLLRERRTRMSFMPPTIQSDQEYDTYFKIITENPSHLTSCPTVEFAASNGSASAQKAAALETPTCTNQSRRWHRFIVTPAADPLNKINSPNHTDV